MDKLYGLNLQRSAFNSESGLVDTMVDLILGSAGALTGMFVTAFKRNRVFDKSKKKKADAENHKEEFYGQH